jgi:YVTN family beta-propeller protein
VRNAFDVAETPDGVQLYVSALADGNVYVLDRESLSLVATLPVGGSPRYVAFDASGTHAIIPNEYGWVTFVHEVPPPPPSACNTPETGPAPTDKTHPSLARNDSQPLGAQPFAVAISRNNVAYITQGWNASAVRANLPSSVLSAPFPVGDLPSQVRMSPDGSTAYVENQDSQTIRYIDVATNQIIAQATVPAGSILNMGLSRDGTRLYALTDYYGVYVIDVNSRAVIAQIPAGNTGTLLTGVAFHPFAACMYISARDQAIVSTVDLTTNAVVGQRVVTGGRIQTLTVSLDGGTLYGADIGRSKIVAWDLPSNAASFTETSVGTPVNRNVFDVEVTPDNAQLWVSTLADGKVYVFDRLNRASLGEINTGGSARYIAFSPTGSQAVIANEMGWVNFVR